jgi:hypothetical protein
LDPTEQQWPDGKNLEVVHKRVFWDDDLGQNTIELYHARSSSKDEQAITSVSETALEGGFDLTKTTVEVVATTEAPPAKIPCTLLQSAPYHDTPHSRHTNWVDFDLDFLADQLTTPMLSTNTEELHPTRCMYKLHGILDCPFHQPCK